MQKSSFFSSLARHEFLFLGLMLLTLHFALTELLTNPLLGSSLLLIHLGLFLIWQPVLNTEQKINYSAIAVSLVLIFALFYLLNWWFIALWIIMLCGITGGSALIRGFGRAAYALATIILFLELSLTITPNLFHLEFLPDLIGDYFFYGITLGCIVIIIWPNKTTRTVTTDYMHTLLISFGLFAFYITSILISFTYKQDYIQSLVDTSLFLAAFLTLVSLLLYPRKGSSTLGQIWEQHILNIGNPFETWVKETSLLGKNNKIKPDLFLQYSIDHILELPWVAGIQTDTDNNPELHGERTSYSQTLTEGKLTLRIFSHIPMGSSLKIHAQLLMRLMTYFYLSKVRELTLQNQTHLKAVYETGSKLTHDIKNILQSLQTLSTVVTTSDDPEQTQELIERQLPLLSQRLQNTLNKLQVKSDTGQSFRLISEWWTEMESRYHGRNIEFLDSINNNITIDTDVFDTIVENLLENARSKRGAQPDVEVTANLVSMDEAFYIEVCDTGDVIPESIASLLFTQILPSTHGYGIGLYQSAQLARKNGYGLALIQNHPGRVCFTISKNSSG
ncbi:MAG: hypothetical protein OQL09_00985 [Gammaproteobacteria bacterium]|nr:hypothetical protein [Gammaproteobacteria bacterium]